MNPPSKNDTPDEGPRGDWYTRELGFLHAKPDANEAEVIQALIRPALTQALSLTTESLHVEASMSHRGRRQRPDLTVHYPGARDATLIVEVKRLGTDLMRRTGRKWATAPLGQLQEYLERYRTAGPNTVGIVTNGTEWIVLRRRKGLVPLHEARETFHAETWSTVSTILQSVLRERTEEQRRRERPTLPDWLASLSECESPTDWLRSVTDNALNADIEPLSHDVSVVKIAEHRDESALFERPVHLCCVKMHYPDGQMSAEDIMQTLSEHRGALPGRIVGMAYLDAGHGEGAGTVRRCRGFIREGERLLSTALVEAELPGSRARSQIECLALDAAKESPKSILERLSTAPLLKSFHVEIGNWFERTRESEHELRHLIRVLFAWLLQTRDILPDNALWAPEQHAGAEREGAIHAHINWLFTEVLAVPIDERRKRPDEQPWQTRLRETAPFLNGSLFEKQRPEDAAQELDNDMYEGPGGLFDILRHYDWTLSERTGYASQTALDPTMLGELFEQLMLKIESVRVEGNRRFMPKGTYYTPQDIADEMVADGIGTWTARTVPGITWEEARTVIHPSPAKANWREWSSKTRQAIREALERITVLDPCCGSGVFIVGVAMGLMRAARRLNDRQENVGARMEKIIERQLHAVDLHPMAALITRLRLFIALVDAQWQEQRREIAPLPNLETRIMTADSLWIEVSGAQRSFGVDGIEKATRNLASARQMWTTAHLPEEKAAAADLEHEARLALKDALRRWDPDHSTDWLDRDLRDAGRGPARVDLRLLLPAPPGGWDLVIGNPPYQPPDAEEKTRAQRLGYAGGARNLYLMFIEAALAVSDDTGVVELIVPNSITFGRAKAWQKVRARCAGAAERIATRTYNNVPEPVFPRLPWVKTYRADNTKNLQRVTIITIVRRPVVAGAATTIAGSGLIRIGRESREKTLQAICPGVRQPEIAEQWTEAATEELVDLFVRMRGTKQRHRQGEPATFPPTAGYFISCLPPQALDNPGRKTKYLPGDTYWLWMGLYNSHLFHAYWLMIGDAFHVSDEETATVRAPAGWQDESLRTRIEEAARTLLSDRVVDQCRVEKSHLGVQHNVNFHLEGTEGPRLVKKLDRLLLDAYGLPEYPLMSQMRLVRTDSAHKLWNQE